MSAKHVQLRNVDMAFGIAARERTSVLGAMSLEVGEGECVALVGPSGCGKTTTLKLIAGILIPTAGDVVVDGGDPRQQPVGLATQYPSLFPWLRVLDNVMLPLRVARPFRDHYRAKRRGEYRDHALALLERVELDGVADKYPWQLSVGMAQRVTLCRALITEPRLLLLDEPFAALDQITKENTWALLQTLVDRTPPITVILVTHDLREAVYLADRVLVMNRKPSSVVNEVAVGDKRPRHLDDTYQEAFLEKVRLLRTYIQNVEC